MMLYKKNGRLFEIIALPGEEINKGSYLIIEDLKSKNQVLVQVIDIDYIDIPGLLEELIREGITYRNHVKEIDPHNISQTIKFLRDTKILTCILRGYLQDGKFIPISSDLPSRISSQIKRLSSSKVLDLCIHSPVKIPIGMDEDGDPVYIDALSLDGSLSLITGMKGTGKSHLAKLILLSLVKLNAPVIVFDLNGEYVGLAKDENIDVYYPGKNLNFTLDYLGRETFLNVMVHVLNLPGVSANILNEIWPYLEKKGQLSIGDLISTINRVINNLMIKDAIISRLMILSSTVFIKEGETTKIENIIKRGKGSVIVLRGLSGLEKKILVEIILSKLVNLLERELIPPLFLFAEEAHMYIRDTYWEDIITRMRHFGLYVIFITNQPDSIDHQIYRQLDNIFVFKFMNDHDLDMLSKVSSIDSQTIKSIARELPRGVCLVVGKVVNDIPIIVNVSPLNLDAMGDTKKVFSVKSYYKSQESSVQLSESLR